MDLQTRVNTPQIKGLITHKTNIFSIGSCFSDNMADRLSKDWFSVCSNPFGVMFNPESIAQTLERIYQNKQFDESDFLQNEDKAYFCYWLHSSFTSYNIHESMRKANEALLKANEMLNKSDVLIITFGTAFVYRLKATEQVVSNCHKTSQSNFNRELLEVSQIVDRYKSLLNKLREKHNFKVIFTVSPIRHLRDGIHENQVSKSVLHLAVEQLTDNEINIYYPSYEILNDELRDYRFYDSDMVHPSPLAIEYIYERFSSDFFDNKTLNVLKEIRICNQMKEHRVKDSSKAEEYNELLNKKIKAVRNSIYN